MLWDGSGAISLTDQWQPGTWSEAWTPCTDERMQSGVPAMSVSVVRCSPSVIWTKATSCLKCPIPQKGRVSLRPPSSAFRGDSSSDNVDAALHTNTTVKSSRFCWHSYIYSQIMRAKACLNDCCGVWDECARSSDRSVCVPLKTMNREQRLTCYNNTTIINIEVTQAELNQYLPLDLISGAFLLALWWIFL